MKIEIKSWYDGHVIFAGEFGSLKLAVEAAVKSGSDLSGSNLRGSDLSRSNLSGSNLSRSDLSRSDLSGSNLSGSNLRGSDLSGSNLSGSNLSGSDLRGSNLRGSNLRGSDLSGSDLSDSNLSGSDLSRSDLSGSNLSGSNLRGSKNAALAIAKTRILPDGDLIGWKKATGDEIIKLRIPAAARRSHAFGRKCRAEFAEVMEIIGGDGKTARTTAYGCSAIYRIGERVVADSWDDDFTQECSHGIHFFITRAEAEAWV